MPTLYSVKTNLNPLAKIVSNVFESKVHCTQLYSKQNLFGPWKHNNRLHGTVVLNY